MELKNNPKSFQVWANTLEMKKISLIVQAESKEDAESLVNNYSDSEIAANLFWSDVKESSLIIEHSEELTQTECESIRLLKIARLGQSADYPESDSDYSAKEKVDDIIEVLCLMLWFPLGISLFIFVMLNPFLHLSYDNGTKTRWEIYRDCLMRIVFVPADKAAKALF